MTIQRQYVLPNCSLILEGISTDASNVLSILANAEFKIVGVEKSLQGGSEFFNALIVAVSAYCQRLLSGFEHPEHLSSQATLVAVESESGQYHRLILKPEILDDVSRESLANSEAKTIQLSTVQLFDMAEAIDQFYADTQTLPDLSVRLAPLPRKYVRTAEPLVQRAMPPLLGFGALAVAALGLFFLPIPELIESEGLQDTAALEETLPDPAGDEPVTDDGSDGPPVSPAEQATVDDATEGEPTVPSPITDSAQLAALQQQVQEKVSGELPADATFGQPLSYQISVAKNGDIVGYNPSDTASVENLDSTPLPALTYTSTGDAIAESVALFDVTFSPDGTVSVVSDQVVIPESLTPEPASPEPVTPEPVTPEPVTPEPVTSAPSATETNDLPEEDASGGEQPTSPPAGGDTLGETTDASGNLDASIAAPIQDTDLIYDLNEGLRRTIIDAQATDWSGPELRYRVRLDNDGNILGYVADNAPAEQYADDLKLPSLVNGAATEKPQLDFLVVISDTSVVEVNPWDGWP